MQIKSKQRVDDHGEVFTPEKEVNAMLDLVKQETDRIECCSQFQYNWPISQSSIIKVLSLPASSRNLYENL